MRPTGTILRDGKTLNEGEVPIARELEERGLCSVHKATYLKCVHREDDDFYNVVDDGCSGEVTVVDGQGSYTCPNCQRTIYRDDKREFSRYTIEIDVRGNLEYVSNLIDESAVSTISRSLDGKLWHSYRVGPLLNVEVEGSRVVVPVIHDIHQEEVVEWMCIAPDNVVPVLVGVSNSLATRFEELNIPCHLIGELYDMDDSEAEFAITSMVTESALRDRLWNVDHRADLSHAKISDPSTLDRMSSRDFEFVSHNVLQHSLGTSVLLGATEAGAGYPDGVFSLHWNNESSLFMWDAKFVRNYSTSKETTLAGEYDKIYRHLSHLKGNQQIIDEFGGVSGIVLFSPEIKSSHINRLAEFIAEQEESPDQTWDGWVILFTMNALDELFTRENTNSAHFSRKPNNFMRGLNALLTNRSRHPDDPVEIASSDYKCIKVDVTDIERLFDDYLESQTVENSEFDRRAFTQYMDWIHT